MRRSVTHQIVSLLVAEDSPHLLSALEDMASTDPALNLVGSASDAGEALEIAANQKPSVGLVDVKMPKGGGLRVVEEIGKVSPDTRVLVFSAHGDVETVQTLLVAGAVGYLIKGTPTSDIADAIKRCAQGESILSTEITADLIQNLRGLVAGYRQAADRIAAFDRTKQEIIQNLSHELRTPITILQGAVQTLATISDRISAEDRQNLIESADRAFARIKRISLNVNAVASLEDGHRLALRPQRVSEILQAIRAEFSEMNGQLNWPDLDTMEDSEFWGDRELSSRALALIVENALAFGAGEPVRVEVASSGEWVRYSILDAGPGLGKELEVLLENFTQADGRTTRTHQGLGIGLYLVKKIMTAHGGEVGARSRSDGGTEFSLWFPAVPRVDPITEELRSL